MMNVLNSISEVSEYHKLIKVITVFYLIPCDGETSLIKGQNVTRAMAEIGQRHINNVCDSNDATLNATEKEHKPKKRTRKGMKG